MWHDSRIARLLQPSPTSWLARRQALRFGESGRWGEAGKATLLKTTALVYHKEGEEANEVWALGQSQPFALRGSHQGLNFCSTQRPRNCCSDTCIVSLMSLGQGAIERAPSLRGRG